MPTNVVYRPYIIILPIQMRKEQILKINFSDHPILTWCKPMQWDFMAGVTLIC